MRLTRRKTTATRSPSALPYPGISSPKLPCASMAVVHDDPPATFGSPALQTLIYATSNDRYPGAPGTLLHRAKIEAARALAAKQREAQREAERREELKRLGIVGMGKKRSTANGNGRFATSPATSDRARRSNATSTASTTATHANGTSTQTNGGGTSTRPARGGNGRNAPPAGAIDPTTLPTPAHSSSSSQQQQQQPNGGVASPLLSASGRLRRPATGSRGASPMPLTAANGGGMVTRTRSPVVPPLELDEKDTAGPGLLSQGNSGLMV